LTVGFHLFKAETGNKKTQKKNTKEHTKEHKRENTKGSGLEL